MCGQAELNIVEGVIFASGDGRSALMAKLGPTEASFVEGRDRDGDHGV
jgi:hypothetical protein